jgi:hypothetical protein
MAKKHKIKKKRGGRKPLALLERNLRRLQAHVEARRIEES